MTEKRYTIGQFAKEINRSTQTLRRWDRDGTLPAKRVLGGQRYYEESDLHKALGLEAHPTDDRKTVVYCRVSSSHQKTDLQAQVDSMKDFCLASEIVVSEWIEEIGGGLNFKRKEFLSLMERIEQGQIAHLLIAHKDRLIRFGFDFFQWFAEKHRCQVTVVNQEKLSPEREMVEDLMSIVNCFSSRLYGLRSYKKRIKEAVTRPEQ